MRLTMRQSKQPQYMPEGGRIIIIGSREWRRMPVPGMAAYAASNQPARAGARLWPVILQPRGIRWKCGAAVIDTDINPEDGPMKS